MNKNIDLTQILKNCPKGTKFYSSVHGDLYYEGMDVISSASRIYFIDRNCRSIASGNYIQLEYLRDGKIYPRKGECVLFPSKDQRDWSKFTAPWCKNENLIQNKFDPKTLKPFDRIIVRNECDDWTCTLFSHINNEPITRFICATCESFYIYCIPYNDETKHLVGTTEEAPDFYKYWED